MNIYTMKHITLITLLILSIYSFAQDSLTKDSTNTIKKISNASLQEPYNPLLPPNTYKNIDNPNYWKNKMPHAAYWQQDIHYTIQAYIDEETNVIDANEQLIYTNNSPDELDIVYFHLYQNAFQPDSYLDKLQEANWKKPRYGEYESQKLGTVIEKISVDGIELVTELDNTILKVLNEEYNWKDDISYGKNQWRMGDGQIAFNNFVYYTIAGFSEYDNFRSNQIREGLISREEALKLCEEDNRTRYDTLKNFSDIIGFNLDDVLSKISCLPKLY